MHYKIIRTSKLQNSIQAITASDTDSRSLCLRCIMLQSWLRALVRIEGKINCVSDQVFLLAGVNPWCPLKQKKHNAWVKEELHRSTWQQSIAQSQTQPAAETKGKYLPWTFMWEQTLCLDVCIKKREDVISPRFRLKLIQKGHGLLKQGSVFPIWNQKFSFFHF